MKRLLLLASLSIMLFSSCADTGTKEMEYSDSAIEIYTIKTDSRWVYVARFKNSNVLTTTWTTQSGKTTCTHACVCMPDSCQK